MKRTHETEKYRKTFIRTAKNYPVICNVILCVISLARNVQSSYISTKRAVIGSAPYTINELSRRKHKNPPRTGVNISDDVGVRVPIEITEPVAQYRYRI